MLWLRSAIHPPSAQSLLAGASHTSTSLTVTEPGSRKGHGKQVTALLLLRATQLLNSLILKIKTSPTTTTIRLASFTRRKKWIISFGNFPLLLILGQS